jgi:YD repeat-containing protein
MPCVHNKSDVSPVTVVLPGLSAAVKVLILSGSMDLGQDPLKVTRVTDPFGRAARFTYDANGFLQTITDTLSLTSSFTYGADGVVTAITTPMARRALRLATGDLRLRLATGDL